MAAGLGDDPDFFLGQPIVAASYPCVWQFYRPPAPTGAALPQPRLHEGLRLLPAEGTYHLPATGSVAEQRHFRVHVGLHLLEDDGFVVEGLRRHRA